MQTTLQPSLICFVAFLTPTFMFFDNEACSDLRGSLPQRVAAPLVLCLCVERWVVPEQSHAAKYKITTEGIMILKIFKVVIKYLKVTNHKKKLCILIMLRYCNYFRHVKTIKTHLW